MPVDEDRIESAQSTCHHPTGVSPAHVADTPFHLSCADVQPVVTLSPLTIQLSSCEVRLYVFTTVYAFPYDTIAHPCTIPREITYTRTISREIAHTRTRSCEISNTVPPISCTHPVLHTSPAGPASHDSRPNFVAYANTCATTHPAKAPQALYAITPKNVAFHFRRETGGS
jgi:hypothetical protein